MSDHLTPLEVLERLIGSKPELDRIGGYKPKASYAWERSSKGRAPGYLPLRAQQAFIRHILKHKIPIPAEWLIVGAPIDDVIAVEQLMKASAA